LLPKGTVFNNIKALGVNSVALVGQLKKEEAFVIQVIARGYFIARKNFDI